MNRSFALRDLLKGMTDGMEVPNLSVKGLVSDSRRVLAGDVFFALPGVETHGLRFADEAERRGAVAIVWDGDDAAMAGQVPTIRVPGLCEHLGHIAARFFDHPSATMAVTAITGTNGKTTVSYLAAQSLQKHYGDCGLFGTLGGGAVGDLKPLPNTTPDALTLQSGFADLLATGVRHVILEASSHGISQHRLTGTDIDVAVLTQLGRDHLDYHLTLEDYAASKKKLFENSNVQTAILNMDDAFGKELSTFCASRNTRVVGYSLRADKTDADIVGTVCSAGRDGIKMEITTAGKTVCVESKLIGMFNASNLLATFAILQEAQCDEETAASLLSSATPVPGRMQLFHSSEQPLVILDYAHTPDAMEHVLLLSRAMCDGEIVCVFGCGGERDSGKRPLMGEVAARLCDKIILTDDNPRRESPQDIILDIVSGMRGEKRAERVTIHRRDRAIKYAIEHVRPKDCVLVLGKGHEHTQDFGDHIEMFSDAEVIRDVLANKDEAMNDAGGSMA